MRIPIKRLISILAMLLVAIFCNQKFDYVEESTGERILNFVDQEIRGTDRCTISAGGWPWIYYREHRYDSLPTLIVWDSIRLVGNMAFWSAMIGFVLWYFRPSRRIRTEPEIPRALPENRKTVRRQWRLLDVMLLLTGVAIVGANLSWVTSRYRASRSLIQRIQSHGGAVAESYILPTLVMDFVRSGYIGSVGRSMNRIVQVSLDDPTPELLREVVRIPTLRSLRLSGESYDLSELEPLTERIGLSDLRISGRRLDADAIQRIGRLKTLQSLNLMRTNITDAGLASMGPMPRLQYLHLGHTDVQLLETERAEWTQSLRVLYLPRPASGTGASMTIENCPNLAELYCGEYDELMNPETVHLTVANNPNLAYIGLDSLQKFDLTLRNLPRLTQIEPIDVSMGDRIFRNTAIANGVWLRRGRLDQVPSLEQCRLYIRDIEDLQCHDSPRLHFHLDWLGRNGNDLFGQSSSRASSQLIRGSAVSIRNWSASNADSSQTILVPTVEVQRIVDAIGRSRGPTHLNLGPNNCSQIDLSPLANCETLTHLSLNGTHVTLQQLVSLARLPLDELELDPRMGMIIDPNNQFGIDPRLQQVKRTFTSQELLDKLPRVKRFRFPPNPYDPVGYAIDSIRLESSDVLVGFLDGKWAKVRDVRLVDLPNYSDRLLLPDSLQSMHVSGTPRIPSLLTTSPWPADSLIKDLENVRFFAVGGANFRDEHFEGVTAYDSLVSLTLGYSGMTPHGLGRIGLFKNLTSIGVSGSEVNDETVERWQDIRDVSTLFIDRTNITHRSIPWIASLRHLRKLSVDTECLQQADPNLLGVLEQLSQIQLVGGEVSAELLRKLNESRSLRELRIHHATLSADALAAIRKYDFKSLKLLELRHCHVDPTEIIALVRELPATVSLCLVGTDYPIADDEGALGNNRLTDDSSRLVLASDDVNSFRIQAGFDEPVLDVNRWNPYQLESFTLGENQMILPSVFAPKQNP